MSVTAEEIVEALKKNKDAVLSGGETFTDPVGVAFFVGISERAVRSYRELGGGPRFLRLGKTTIRYSIADLADWLNEKDQNEK